MDSARAIELEALRHQKPMNDVIERGDSDVQQFYCDVTVFVTGGSGFIGKQLIEKLFRACQIKKMYLLTRSKKNLTIQDRLHNMLNDPVYDLLRSKQPQFADRIVPVEGDVADVRLGLSEKDWTMITEEVNIIFHVAAMIRFNEPLRKAIFTNVRGTREALQLAKECNHLKQFVHISTAFSHASNDRIDTEVLEQFYPSPVPPHAMITFAEEVDEDRLNDITTNLIQGWPNTYTFTKMLAEELIRTSSGDLPLCIVRPPMVLPAYYEPSPGWTDISTVAGPTGMYLGAGLGVVHVFNVGSKSTQIVAPVDYVNNAIIASAWDSTERRNSGDKDIHVYTIGRELQFGTVVNVTKTQGHRIQTPSAVWLSDGEPIKNWYLYTFLSWILQYIPAYLLDFACYIIGKRPKEITSFVDVFKKLDKLEEFYDYFAKNDWQFKDYNLKTMIERMSDADKAIFNCDLSKVDIEEYILCWGLGIRRFIIKEDLKNTDIANRKQKIFKILCLFIVPLYLFTLWLIAKNSLIFVFNMLALGLRNLICF